MDNQALMLLGGLIGLLAICWPAYQFISSVVSKFARKSDMDDIEKDVHKLKTQVSVHSMYGPRIDAAEKLLEDRREDVKDIYKEIGEIRKDLNTGINSIKDILLNRK